MRVDLDSVPRDFWAAAQAVAGGLSGSDLEWLRQRRVDRARAGEDERAGQARQAAIECHHGLGRHLRNAWSLWEQPETPLRAHVRELLGLEHPDDVSGVVLLAGFMLALDATREEAEVAARAEAERYLAHWRAQRPGGA